jgi:DNA-binding transcriptional ArsR family regulator
MYWKWHIKAVIETFSALAHPQRLGIVELLRAGPRTVGGISERLDLEQPQVSKHLRLLKRAGLVDVEPRAQQRIYRLRGQALRELHIWLERYRQVWDERFGQLDELLVELEGTDQNPSRGRRKRSR